MRAPPHGCALCDDARDRGAFEAFADVESRMRGDDWSNVDARGTRVDASFPRFVAANVGERTCGPGEGASMSSGTVYASCAMRGRRWTTSDGWEARSGTFARADGGDGARGRRTLRTSEGGCVRFVVMDDWSGEHEVVGAREGAEGGTEGAWYRRGTWGSGRRIDALRGVVCSCATFAREEAGGGNEECVEARALVGTSDGRVFDVRMDVASEQARRLESSCECAFESRGGEAIAGVQAFRSRGADGERRYGVVIATASKLYVLVGSYSLESVLAKARAKPGGVEATMEMPVDCDRSTLCVWRGRKSSSLNRIAWLTGAGVFRGTVNLETDDATSALEQHGVLPFPKVEGEDSGPISLTMTEHHILLLFSKCMVAVNGITGDVEGRIELPVGGKSTFAFTDPTTSTAYVANEKNLLQIIITDEDANMWRVHCGLNDYDKAIEACKSSLQRQFVYTTKAERMLRAKRFKDAGEAFAKAGTAHSIETVAKTFIDLNAREGLYAYIEGRLRELPSEDAPRRLILAMWLLEEYVKVASLTRDERNEAKIRDFLREYFKALDERETLRILSEAKRMDDEIYFAELCGDYDRVLDHFIQLGDARRALEISTSPRVPRETLNRILPTLIERLPKESIDFMLSREHVNDNVKIIDALSRDDKLYDKSFQAGKVVLSQLARYLESITAKPDGVARSDTAVHGVLLNLYVKQLDSSPTVVPTLSKYLLDAVDEATKQPYYDVQYAIRMCEKHGAHRSAVYAYCVSRDYDMAMHVALSTLQDIELAKMVSAKAAETSSGDENEDEIVQKKLWIEIAKWSLRKSGALEKHTQLASEEEKRTAIREALGFLKETNGALRVEDILPLLPDFTIIDDVKDLVLQSLTEHRAEIEKLRQGLEELTAFTQEVQDDIEDMEQKTIVISKDEKCRECGKPVVRLRLMERAEDPTLLAPFYVFPCEMAYHTECLMRRVLPLMFADERKRSLALMRTLKVPLPRQLKPETKHWGAPPKAVTDKSPIEAVLELEELLCSDCPDCGALASRVIQKPPPSPADDALRPEFGSLHPDDWDHHSTVGVPETDAADARLSWAEFSAIPLPDDWPNVDFPRPL